MRCEYPDLPPHDCQHVEEDNHLRAWHTLSVRLDWQRKGVRPDRVWRRQVSASPVLVAG